MDRILGSGLWDGEGLWYEADNWAYHRRGETSNWKEANSLTLKVEEVAKDGKLNNAELFIFTDNSLRALSSGKIQGPRSSMTSSS